MGLDGIRDLGDKVGHVDQFGDEGHTQAGTEFFGMGNRDLVWRWSLGKEP